jgi:hypothetical protein
VFAGFGEDEVEFGSALGEGFEANASPVGDDEFPTDGQAETGAGLGLTGDAKEALEHAVLIFGRDAGALVPHAEPHASVLPVRGGHDDFSVFGGVFPGVGDEVGKDVFDALDVHGNCRERGIRFAVELETAGFHQFLERLNRVTKQNIRGRGFPVQTSVALFEAGEIEQVIQDAKEAFGVFAGGGDQVELFWIEGSDSVLEQQMQDHADGGEGGIDFVADGCDEVALGIVEEPEPGDVVQDGGDA